MPTMTTTTTTTTISTRPLLRRVVSPARRRTPATAPPPRASAEGAAGDERDVGEDKPKRRHRHHHHHVRPKPKPGPPIGGAVNRPVGFLPPHKLSLTPEERAAPPPTPVERGRSEVAALCSVLPEGSEERLECEDALEYYERMAAGEGEACSLAAAASAAAAQSAQATSSSSPSSPSSPSPPSSAFSSRFADPSCADEKERFESFVRELLYANSVSGFVKALGRRKREEERRKGEKASAAAAGSDGTSSSSSSARIKKIDADTERRREALIALFRRYDRDGNGRLDAAEFREAAAAAGDPLSGDEVAKIFTALDISSPHGAVGLRGVTLDDFLQAVEAEDFMKPASPLAAWLRAHAGGGKGGVGGAGGGGGGGGEVELPGGIDQLL